MTTMTKNAPRYVQIPAYKFSKLSDRAKDRVRDWLREGDDNWWEYIYTDFVTVAECFGFEVRHCARHVIKPTDTAQCTMLDPCIWWMNNYGWSAGFDAQWSLLRAVKCGEKIREHAPEDELLHKLADALEASMTQFIIVGLEPIMREGDVYADVRGSEHGINDDSELGSELVWAVVDGLEELNEIQQKAANDLSLTVNATAKDLARWLAKQLEAEDTYRSSDEAVNETCEANEYLFDEDGAPVHHLTSRRS